MKKIILHTFFPSLALLIVVGCSSNSNDPEFLKKVEGRYLFTPDEIVSVHSKDNMILLEWRGADAIKPSKINDDTFFVKEMNAKIQFLTNPDDQKQYLVFVPKDKDDKIEYIHKKLSTEEKIPSEYLANSEYEKALKGYLAIKEKDSLSPTLRRRGFRNKGYDYLRKDSIQLAIDVFKVNIALHPKKSNPYDTKNCIIMP